MPHRFSGIPEVAGRSRSRFLERLQRSDFPVSRKIPELLPLNAADLLCSRPLTKTDDKDTITSTAQADPLIPEEFLSQQAEPPLFSMVIRLMRQPCGQSECSKVTVPGSPRRIAVAASV